jgi:hypothetical protein
MNLEFQQFVKIGFHSPYDFLKTISRKSMNKGERVTSEHAKNLLEKRFTGQEEKKSKLNKKLTVLLVDELDMLWNRSVRILNLNLQ